MKQFLPYFVATTRTNNRTYIAPKLTTQAHQASTYSLLGQFFEQNPGFVMSTFVATVGTGIAWLKYDINRLENKIEQTNEKVEQGFSDIRKGISELKVLFFQKQAEDSQQKAEKLEAASKAKPGFWGNSSH